MTRNYAITGTALVLLTTLGAWPFVGPAGRLGIVLAGVVALPVQIGSYALLERHRNQVNGFLAAWVGGTLVRMIVIGAVAGVVIWSRHDAGLPMLLALASFFFVLLLLEPVYFRRRQQETA
jgi:hypothetical protein